VGEQQRRRFIAGQTDFNSRLETVLTVESATLAVYLVIFTSRYDAFGNAGSRTDRLPPHTVTDIAALCQSLFANV